MKVIVTGATGFVGSWVLPCLTSRGHEVVGVGRGYSPTWAGTGVRWLPVDLLDPVEAAEMIARENPEGLLHFAWATAHGSYWSSTDNLRWVGSSLYLVEAFARAGGKRLVVAGSSAEYSWKAAGTLSELGSPVDPDSLYGVSKNALRQIVERWAPTAGLSWAWGRIFCPFGPGEKPERLVPKIAARLAAGAILPFDSGSEIRDFIHVSDLGAAFAALFDSRVEGVVNMATGRATSVRELVTIIANKYGVLERVCFDSVPDQPGQPARLVADVQRLRDEVGWQPLFSLRQRVEEACAGWKAS